MQLSEYNKAEACFLKRAWQPEHYIKAEDTKTSD